MSVDSWIPHLFLEFEKRNICLHLNSGVLSLRISYFLLPSSSLGGSESINIHCALHAGFLLEFIFIFQRINRFFSRFLSLKTFFFIINLLDLSVFLSTFLFFKALILFGQRGILNQWATRFHLQSESSYILIEKLLRFRVLPWLLHFNLELSRQLGRVTLDSRIGAIFPCGSIFKTTLFSKNGGSHFING